MLYTYAWVNHNQNPAAALACLNESIELSNEGLSTSTEIPALGMNAILRARAGDTTGALQRLRDAIIAARYNGDLGMISEPIDDGIIVFFECDDAPTAAALVGATTQGFLAPIKMDAHGKLIGLDDTIEQIRTTLSIDDFEAVANHGAKMSLDELIAFVLDAIDHHLSDLTGN
jgi:hypothetical protein